MLFRDGEAPIRLKTGGMVVGMFPDARYVKDVVILHPSDLLLIYSDGISEASNEQEDEYGEERLMKVVQANRSLDGRSLQDAILADVSSFVGTAPQADDMTLVIVRVL